MIWGRGIAIKNKRLIEQCTLKIHVSMLVEIATFIVFLAIFEVQFRLSFSLLIKVSKIIHACNVILQLYTKTCLNKSQLFQLSIRLLYYLQTIC